MAKITVTVDNSDGKLSPEAKKAAFELLKAVEGFPDSDAVEYTFIPSKAVAVNVGGHGSEMPSVQRAMRAGMRY